MPVIRLRCKTSSTTSGGTIAISAPAITVPHSMTASVATSSLIPI